MASMMNVVVIFAGCLLLCSAASLQPNGTDCSEVRRTFVVKGIGQAQLVPETWTKGDELQLCPSAQTCCSKSMEEKYQEAVKKDFKSMIQGAGAYLKTLISTSATKFRDTFLDMVEIAENSTYALFAEVYKTLESEARIPLSQLFADLLAYLSGQPVDLEERVNSFFDSLFPLAYRHSLNTNQDFSEAFKECLRDGQAEIRPFSDLPEKIALQISRSFETARTFLQALNLAVEVINTTEHMDFGPECRKAFVRLSYCPHCQGLIHARPCAGMCLNVIRGCLSSVSELDSSWSEYVSALERLTSGMVGIYNIEQVLSNFDNKLSETIMYVNENAVEIAKRVKQKCGTLRRVTREVSPVTSNPPSSAPYLQPIPDTSLYMLLQNFVHKLSESKDFYANLADRICSDGNLVVKGELRCWNGNDLAEYTKTVAGIGITAQKYNPEMKAPIAQDIVVKTMADKLQHIKQELNNQVTSVPQSDSSVLLEGSGSGGAFSDDEDYAGASGSGDFQKEPDPGSHDGSSKGVSVAGAQWNKGTSIYVLLLLILISSCLQSQLLRWQ